MATQTVDIAPGQKITIEPFDDDEDDVFDREWPIMTKVSALAAGKNDGTLGDLLREHFDAYKESYRIIGQAAKHRLDPSPGTFQGMHAQNGFGWRPGIMPDLIVPTAQARTYETALTGLTVASWYGLYHNGTIGAAYHATPLYMGKQTTLGITGILETADVVFDQFQWELKTKKQAIHSALLQFMAGDYPFYDFGATVWLEPAKQYRSQARAAVVAGTTRPLPIGIEFSSVEIMKAEAPTEPSTTAP